MVKRRVGKWKTEKKITNDTGERKSEAQGSNWFYKTRKMEMKSD